jgi:hypothetical protein
MTLIFQVCKNPSGLCDKKRISVIFFGSGEMKDVLGSVMVFIIQCNWNEKCLGFEIEFVCCAVKLTMLFYSKNGKLQKRGKVNLVGRLQLSTERSKEEDNESIVQLRILRVQVRFTMFCLICLYALYSLLRLFTNVGVLKHVHQHNIMNLS